MFWEQQVPSCRFAVNCLTAFPIFFRHGELRYTDVSTVMIMVCCGLRTTLAVQQYDIIYYRDRPKTCVYVLPLNPRVVCSTGRSPTNISQDLYKNIRLTRTQMLVCLKIGKYSAVFQEGRSMWYAWEGGMWWENLKETRFEHRRLWWEGNIKMNLRIMKREVVDELNLRIETSGGQLSKKKAGNSVIGRGAVRFCRYCTSRN